MATAGFNSRTVTAAGTPSSLRSPLPRPRVSRSGAAIGWLILLLSLASGCLPAPLCPARWGKPWYLQTSPHYVLLSDIGEREAKQRLEQFETAYQSLETLAFHSDHQSPRDRLQVVLFRSRGDYESVVSTTTAGQFHHNGLDTDEAPHIVMFGDLDNDTLQTFQHELTHYFVAHYAPNAPLWLTEGLATYFETLRQEEGSAHLGLPSSRHLRTLLSEGVVPFSDLLAASRSEFYGDPTRYYGSAWLLLHLLHQGPQGYRDRLYSYVNALSSGTAPGEAFAAVFGDLGPTRLGAEYKEYLGNLEMTYLRAPLSIAKPALSPRYPLTAAEVHIVWAALRDPTRRSQAKRQKLDLDEALAHDANAPDVLYHLARWHRRQNQLDQAERLLLRALDSRPDEPRYLTALLRVHEERMASSDRGRQAEAEVILARLLPVAQSAGALNTIARFHAQAGRDEVSTYYAKRAVAADPRCQPCRLTLAQQLSAAQQYAPAVHELERAINLLPHDSVPSPQILQRLRHFRTQAWAEFKRQLGERVATATTAAGPAASPSATQASSCTVCLRIDTSGQLSSSAVTRSSGNAELNQVVQAAIQDLHRLVLSEEPPRSGGQEKCLLLTQRPAQPLQITEQP